MNIALITAGGVGERMHQEIPKQFLHIENKPVLIYTLEAFEHHPNIDAMIVVTLDGWKDLLWAYARQFNITKLRWIVSGGETGQQSIFNGLKKLKEENIDDNDIVMIHDGIRPMVSSDIISNNLATVLKYGNATVCIPCREVMMLSEDRLSSVECINRDKLLRTQTPQSFYFKDIWWAHEEAGRRGITTAVASCSLMETLGKRVFFSEGSEKNVKITTLDDLDIFKALLHTHQDEWLKR
ncbi:MAG: IspD/TarI family cytidylyltransferase [Prevotellaceae bacterium]|nr:IspD/TarI family cytidylyltransferase [Prevotellaceae bacterium]